jgi:vacuolar-type H+-ATPase subunit I/STV1
MRSKFTFSVLAALTLLILTARPAVTQEKKDYLTTAEANKIRDAETLSARMKLFVTFAEDRLTKLKYVLAHPSTDRRRPEELNALLNAYTGCIDDASDLIDVARNKQQDIRAGLKVLGAKGKEYLTYLQELAKTGAELDSYKETLDDAIEATQDALTDAAKAEKEISAPIRRKQ